MEALSFAARLSLGNNSYSAYSAPGGATSRVAAKPLHNGAFTKTCIVNKKTIFKVRSSRVASQQPYVLKAESMFETYDILAQRLLHAAVETKPDRKYIVGIAGPPGAGKSTVSREVSKRLNNLYRAHQKDSKASDISTAVPMDGFHLYRFQLDAMKDPVEAHARRGAPWTFNPDALFVCLNTLRDKNWALFPSFDHGVGDPVEQDIEVTPKHRVVLVEGNYLLLDQGEWEKIAELFDERWFISLDLDTAMQRVERRHISTGKTKEIASQRIEYNDRPNAELILQTRDSADLIIHSINLD